MSIDDLAAAALPPLRPVGGARRPRSATSPRTTPTASRTRESGAATPCASTAPATAPRTQIESELQWVDALREDGAVDTCVPGPRARRRAVVGRVDGLGDRNVVLFEWLPGRRARPRGRRGARRLPRARRRLRAHARARARVEPARRLRPPRLGLRRTRSAPAATGAAGRTASAWARRSCALLERLDAAIAAPPRGVRAVAPTASGSSTPTSASPTCSSTTATCASSTSTTPASPGSCTTSRPRSRSWRTTRACPSCATRGSTATARSRRSTAADEAELDTFVMLRRLLLVAWIGSHHTFATEAAELGAGFTAGTCALAERYLSTHS